MNEQPKVSDSIVFPATPLERSVADAIVSLPCSSHWRAFNGIRHLNCAWKIRDVDREMALFRAITAEEELASAILLSLKQHRYQGSGSLNHRAHDQKAAVILFFSAVTEVFARARSTPETEIYFDESYDPARLRLRFKIRTSADQSKWASPVPPLHFSFSRSRDGGPFQLHDFAEGIRAVATKAGVKSIVEHIRERANRRNLLLYAADVGYPKIQDDVMPLVEPYRRNVLVLAKLYLLIEQWPKRQDFVQQALASFSRVLVQTKGKVLFE